MKTGTTYMLTAKSSTFLFLLSSLFTSSQSFAIHRAKRGTVTIGDLPSIIPPTKIKNGESKFPSPGWTHCIKYLKADVRWRSIKGVNMKKLQATQFQCSWYITSEAPGSQIRVSFEKLDFGGDSSNSCTQQFLELIDIKTGVAQARMCGNKRYGDYVSVGQRVRIDIQGEEPLVEKLRGNEDPFVINYKIVREPAGFRVGGSTKGTVLKNRVKQTVGTVVERPKIDTRGKNIFGVKNQPGANDPPQSDTEPSGRSSLTIWQVVLIIVICFSVVFCIVGVIVKRMVFDKKKEEKYMNADEDLVSEGKDHDPVEYTATIPLPNINTGKNDSDVPEPHYLNTEKELIRSTSKPETANNRAQEPKRHNSQGDVTTKPKLSRYQKWSTSDEYPEHFNGNIKYISETIIASSGPLQKNTVDDTPRSRAPRKSTFKNVDNMTSDPPRASRHKEGRAKKKKRKTDENDNRVKSVKSPKKNGENTTGHRRQTESKPKRPAMNGTSDIRKTGEIVTPTSRPGTSHKKPRSKKRREKVSEGNPTAAKQNDGVKPLSGDGITKEQKNVHLRKKRERPKKDDRPAASKKPKTVSSGVKKTTMSGTNGRKSAKKKSSSHRNQHSQSSVMPENRKTREAKRDKKEKSAEHNGTTHQRRH